MGYVGTFELQFDSGIHLIPAHGKFHARLV